MVKEYQKIKVLLQDAAEVKMDLNAELKGFKAVSFRRHTTILHGLISLEDIESMSSDARTISMTYENAISRADSLSERDARSCHEKLQTSEVDLDAALAAIQGQKEMIVERDQVIDSLHQTIDAIIQSILEFTQGAPPEDMQATNRERMEEVMQLVADYSHDDGISHSSSSQPVKYLRIAENSFKTLTRRLRDTEDKVDRYRELARGQNDLIKTKSADLDQRVADYNTCLQTIRERDHELILLVSQCAFQREKIDEYEVAKTEQDQLLKQY